MKTITMKTLATGMVAGMILFISCSKEGPTGPQGVAGTNGTNGTNGVANIAVETFTLNSGNWSYSTTYLDYTAVLNDAALIQSVQDSGAVEVFYSINSGSLWSALPCTINVGSGAFYTFAFSSATAAATLTWTYFGSGTGTDPSTAFSGANLEFKVVTIPPALRKANPNVNFHDYNDIKKHFKL
jgi:hypothetical protein